MTLTDLRHESDALDDAIDAMIEIEGCASNGNVKRRAGEMLSLLRHERTIVQGAIAHRIEAGEADGDEG